MSIDLHVHSNASDGSFTPAELVAAGHAAGLSAMSLTDHDTISGWPEFSAAAHEVGMRVLSGVEISCAFADRAVHLLGYGFDAKDEGLCAMLGRLREGRTVRNRQILERLDELGCPLSAARLAEIAGGESVGRPHVAQALIEAGCVETFREAFDRFLAKGSPAYVERWRPDMAEAVAVLHHAGGCAVLAHPYAITDDANGEMRPIVQELVALGLDGLEALYTRYGETRQQTLRALARDFGLLITGGSDFHGACTPDIHLGAREIPDAIFDDLSALCAQ